MSALSADAIQDVIDNLREREAAVRKQESALEAQKRCVDKSLDMFKSRVKLNVGGSKFETTLSTLTRYPESMLGTMFSGRDGISVPVDDDGYVFIDRDGTHFRSILNFLRSGVLKVTKEGCDFRSVEYEELWLELEFYMLDQFLPSHFHRPRPAHSGLRSALPDRSEAQIVERLLRMNYLFVGCLPGSTSKLGCTLKGPGCSTSDLDTFHASKPGCADVNDLLPGQFVVVYIDPHSPKPGDSNVGCGQPAGQNPFKGGCNALLAFRHATGRQGGWAKITRVQTPLRMFAGSERNGVTSLDYDATREYDLIAYLFAEPTAEELAALTLD